MKAERKYYWGRQVKDMSFILEIRQTDCTIRYDGVCTRNGVLKAENPIAYWISNGEEAHLTALELKEVDEKALEHWLANYGLWSDLHWEKM